MAHIVCAWLAVIITPSPNLGPSTISSGWEGSQRGRERGALSRGRRQGGRGEGRMGHGGGGSREGVEVLVSSRFQEGLLTNAKVYTHVTIRIKVCHSDNDVFTILYT